MKTTPKVAQNNAPQSVENESAAVIAHPSTPAQDEAKQQPAPEPAAPAAEQAAPISTTLSRMERLQQHQEKYKTLRRLNESLNTLEATRTNIEGFVFEQDETNTRYYQGLTLTDDKGSKFETKNPTLCRLLVAELRKILDKRITEVQTELLEIAI